MNVLVTRPDERGQQLVEMLSQQQIFAIHQPLFSLEAGRELPTLPALLSSLNPGDYLFAVSKSAVEFAHQTLSETGFGWRNDLRYFAVGQGSANYFSGLSAQAVRYPSVSSSSEGVLALPEMQEVAGKTVVILRAESGRELFSTAIAQRGATVKCVECYRRIPFVDGLGEKISLARRAGIDLVVASSREILTILLENTLESDRQWLLDCRLVVVSQRIADYALELGWQAKNIFLSEKADNSSLLKTLLGIVTLK